MLNFQVSLMNKLSLTVSAVFQFCKFPVFLMDPIFRLYTTEPQNDKTNKMACAPSEDSDQPGHPPSLIRVFAVHMKKAWVSLATH